MSTKILLADDHIMMRDGLCALLKTQPGFEVVGLAKDGREAVRLALDLKPDVVVMDINMPGLNGMDATRQILSEVPEIKVIALSMYSDRRYVAGMLKAGVCGYLLKNAVFDELTEAISRIVQNKTFLSCTIADLVLHDYAKFLSNEQQPISSILTNREREVLQLIAEGFKPAAIASRLHVSVKTVSTHRKNIMDKLHKKSVAELTRYALQEGLISFDR